MRATASEIDPTHVTITVELDDADLKEAIDATTMRFAQQMQIKGFRKGKAPRQLIEARLGGASVLRGEAISNSIGTFYARAVSDTMVDPISQPDVKITSGEEEGDVIFEAEVEVRPLVEISGQRSLKVTIPSPIVNDDEVERQLIRIRETDSVLNVVDRPIVTDDVIVIDVTATSLEQDGETQDLEDLSYTVGSGQLARGIDEMLIGLRAGEEVEAVGDRSGALYRFNIAVKRVNERVLPELTDEWAAENTDHETVEALRDALVTQLRRMKIVEAKFAQRDSALAALSELVPDDVIPPELEQLELQYRIDEFEQRIAQQGMDFAQFLQVTGQSDDQFVELLRNDARRAVRVDLALRALAREEGLEPDEETIENELVTTAQAMKATPEQLRESLRDNGRTSSFVAEIAKLNASKWLLENAIYVDENGAEIDRSLLDASVDDVAPAHDESDGEPGEGPADDGSGDTDSE